MRTVRDLDGRRRVAHRFDGLSVVVELTGTSKIPARFDTHQGLKGLEFDRVMVIMDDTEAPHVQVLDLFGAKPTERFLKRPGDNFI